MKYAGRSKLPSGSENVYGVPVGSSTQRSQYTPSGIGLPVPRYTRAPEIGSEPCGAYTLPLRWATAFGASIGASEIVASSPAPPPLPPLAPPPPPDAGLLSLLVAEQPPTDDKPASTATEHTPTTRASKPLRMNAS
jgi:hypothetical protein